MTRWRNFLRGVARAIWFRAVLFTLAGLLLVAATVLASRAFPHAPRFTIGQGAVGDILGILATSMLAVTTFSLAAMVTAYSSASSSGTPRSTQLLVQDRTSQNALSTFVGTFAFSILGLIALSLDLYNETGRTLLFAATLTVVVIVIVTLLRWIDFLTGFGRHSDIIARVGEAAGVALAHYAEDPRLGAAVWEEPPPDASPVMHAQQGYLTLLDGPALQTVAERYGLRVWVLRQPGSRVTRGRPIALVQGLPTDASANATARDALCRAFVVERQRTYDQDPRLGLIALSEIASRALSPAVNDPGTAIEVLAMLHDVLSVAVAAQAPDRSPASPEHERVFIRPLPPEELLRNGFRAIGRDGAGVVEVAGWLQRELGRLLEVDEGVWRAALVDVAAAARARAETALVLQSDRDEVERLHRRALRFADRPSPLRDGRARE
ncbi:MAG TPA: DUF2254 domain-containing protein [Miltoncostaeaceae bacterium]|mgnify:CR=1 FL=1|nr:DUF2254 domain-containing protein [Miltoncostaeaceae bacterium]